MLCQARLSEQPDMGPLDAQSTPQESIRLPAMRDKETDLARPLAEVPSNDLPSCSAVASIASQPEKCSTWTANTKHSHLVPDRVRAVKQRLAEIDATEDELTHERRQLRSKRRRQDEELSRLAKEEESRIKQEDSQADAYRQKLRDDAARQRHHERSLTCQSMHAQWAAEDAEYQKKDEALQHELDQLRLKLGNLKRAHSPDDDLYQEQTGDKPHSLSPPSKKHRSDRAGSQGPSPPHPQRPQQSQHPVPRHSISYNWPYQYTPGGPYAANNQNQILTHNVLPPISNGAPPHFSLPHPTNGGRQMPQAITFPSENTPASRQSQALTPQPGPPPPPPTNPPAGDNPFSGFQSVNQPLEIGDPPNSRGSPPQRATPGSTGTRKPPSTHPYSQSEAFAKRHQPCERADDFDRGIWTYFGPGGSRDAPSVAETRQMYLRCPHDDCLRMDWKTIHGLQCHIVKTHGVAKGTIGSLELALEHYGVDFAEVTAYEKDHGPGSAGTRAEKALSKAKMRARKSNETPIEPSVRLGSEPRAASVSTTTSASISKPVPVAKPRPRPSAPLVLFPNLTSPSAGTGYVQDDIVYSEDDSESDETSPPSRAFIGRENAEPFEMTYSHPYPTQVAQDRCVSTPTNLPNPAQPVPTNGDGTSNPPDLRPNAASGEPAQHVNASMPSTAPWPPQNSVQSSKAEESLLPMSQTNGVSSPGNQKPHAATSVTATSNRLPNVSSPSRSVEPPQRLKLQSQETKKATSSVKTPGSGTFRPRVPASERWTWAPIEDDDSKNKTSGATIATSNSAIKGKDDAVAANDVNSVFKARRKNGNTVVFTKAQQELQGIDTILRDDDNDVENEYTNGDDNKGYDGGGGDRDGAGSRSGSGAAFSDDEADDGTYGMDLGSSGRSMSPTSSSRRRRARTKTRRTTQG